MITLTFTRPFGNPTSPLVMLFGDSGDPVVRPEEPEQIGIYNITHWRTVANTVNKLFVTRWKAPEALSTYAPVNWFDHYVVQYTQLRFTQLAKVFNAYTYLQNSTGAVISQLTRFSYSRTEHVSQFVNVSWQQNPSLFMTETTLNFSECFQVEHIKSVVFNNTALTNKFTYLAWHGNAEVLPTLVKFEYGFKPYEFVCTWLQHPKNGLVKLFFDDAQDQEQAPLTMLLNQNGRHCVLVRNEPLIRGASEQPVLNRNIPIKPQLQRTYIMQPTLDCVRVSDGQVILLSSFSYQLSRTQFAATGTLKFSSRIDYERAKGELLKITCNGYDFYLLVEQATINEAFSANSYSATCRGRFAELSAPYANSGHFTNTTPRTFIGLISEILQTTPWTVISNIIDYTVPVNAFSYQDKTPAEAVKICADAIGAMLVFDDENQTVTVSPKWPVMPWATETATCDVIINDSVILSHNKTDVVSPLYNVVQVRGEQKGVAVDVKLTNTLADTFAPDAVSPLIGTVQAARQRGSCDLANAGNKKQSVIRTKIMPDLPPIKPGMLLGIQYGQDIYKATCDSATYTATTDRKGALTVNQTFTVLKRAV